MRAVNSNRQWYGLTEYIHIKPDLQAELTERAKRQGLKLDETEQDVVARYFEEEDRFIEAVKRGGAGSACPILRSIR